MSFTIWFTGIPCSGKSTLSHRLYRWLQAQNCPVHLLDGDAVRAQMPHPPGFSQAERDAHGRRLGALALSLNRKGIVTIVAAITPYAATRDYNRRLLGNYVEVFCSCPVAAAESRDRRGLYARARSGRLPNFTGVSDPYEEPRQPEVVVFTHLEDVDDSLAKIVDYLEGQGLIPVSWDSQPERELVNRGLGSLT